MKTVFLEEMSWKDVEEYLSRQNVILLPVGSIEQSGPHLPLATDSMHVQYVAEKAAQQCQVLVAPSIKWGISYNHIDFPGTITLQPETLIALITDVCRSLSHHGFKKILLANGHGVNTATLDVAIIKMKTDLPDTIIGHLYPGFTPPEAKAVLEDSMIGHADEGATSRMLVMAPHLVRMDRARKEVPQSTSRLFKLTTTDIVAQMTSYGFPRTKSVTKSGIFGDASLAKEEKGRVLLEGEIKRYVNEIERLKDLDLKDYTEGWPRI